MTTLRESLNRSQLNTIADALGIIKLGSVLAAVTTAMRGADPAANSYVNAAAEVPDLQQVPAARITRAYARAAGTPGALTVVTTVPPAAGQISLAPNGSILVLAADLITDLDVQYEPHVGDIYETTQPVASDSLAIPQYLLNKKVVLAMEVEALTGTATGKKIILAPGAAPAAGQAALNDTLSTVEFAAADAVTSARVKLLVGSEADLQALLAGDSPVLLQHAPPGREDTPMTMINPTVTPAAAGTPAGVGNPAPPKAAPPGAPKVAPGAPKGAPAAPGAPKAQPGAPKAPSARPAQPGAPPAPKSHTLTQQQLDERLARGKRSMLKKMFGVEDESEAQARLQRWQELEAQDEERQRAAMTEQQRLQSDLERTQNELQQVQQQLEREREQVVVQQQQSAIEKLASEFIHPDLVSDASFRLARELSKMDAKQVDKMKEADLRRWFQDLAKKSPSFAKPTGAPAPAPKKRPAGAPKPTPRAQPAPGATPAAPTKTFKPGQPNSMSRQEAKAEAAKQGIRW